MLVSIAYCNLFLKLLHNNCENEKYDFTGKVLLQW